MRSMTTTVSSFPAHGHDEAAGTTQAHCGATVSACSPSEPAF